MHNVHAYLLQLIYLFIYLFMAPAWWSLNSILCTDGLVMRFTQVCCIFIILSLLQILLLKSIVLQLNLNSLREKHCESGNMRGRRNTSGWKRVQCCSDKQPKQSVLWAHCGELGKEDQAEMKDLLREALYFCRLALCEHIAETLRSCIQRCRCYSETRALSGLI